MNCPRLYGQHKKAPANRNIEFYVEWRHSSFKLDALVVIKMDIMINERSGFFQ